ncbi:hypothetical protein ACSQ67_000044 [Phaseolus vulgaris]
MTFVASVFSFSRFLCLASPSCKSFFKNGGLVSNLTVLYVAVIACIKLYGFACGRSFGGAFVLLVSTATVALILVATLTWDVSRKATYAFAADHSPPPSPPHHAHEPCKGGICWHGVAVRSPASQVRFRLPQNLPHTTL